MNRIAVIFVRSNPPCHACHAAIQELKKQKIKYEAVDVCENPRLANMYQVKSLPTILDCEIRNVVYSVRKLREVREKGGIETQKGE